MFNIPKEDNDYFIINAFDSEIDLVNIYNKKRKTVNGKTISDISLVFQQLIDWLPIEKADLIIPYKFAHKRNEPKGHRIWYLSQPKKNNNFYNGSFFDIKMAKNKQKIMRKECKLSQEAIKFFNKYLAVKENKGIELCK